MNAIFKIQWPRIHSLQDGGVTTVSPDRREPLGYWTQEEFTWDIVTKYCYRARMKFLPPRVDVQVDNQAVILA